MKAAELRELQETRPFIPFTLSLADGRKLNVIHNEFFYLFPSGRIAIVHHPDERFTLIDLRLVTSADVDPKFRSRPPKRPNKRA